uniref:Uncharacterized protein n=1 Tax=Anopheles maculatus TaxID=74869 RepID=A0A182SXM7_9DIPT
MVTTTTTTTTTGSSSIAIQCIASRRDLSLESLHLKLLVQPNRQSAALNPAHLESCKNITVCPHCNTASERFLCKIALSDQSDRSGPVTLNYAGPHILKTTQMTTLMVVMAMMQCTIFFSVAWEDPPPFAGSKNGAIWSFGTRPILDSRSGRSVHHSTLDGRVRPGA